MRRGFDNTGIASNQPAAVSGSARSACAAYAALAAIGAGSSGTAGCAGYAISAGA